MLKKRVAPTIGISTNNANPLFTTPNDTVVAATDSDTSQMLISPPKNIIDTPEVVSQNKKERRTKRNCTIQTSENATSVPLVETTTIENTSGEKITIKEITNKKDTLQKRIFVTYDKVEYTMTPKSMRTICRICFSTENLSCMFTTTYKDIKMSDIISKFISRRVPQGRLSRNLCLKCIKTLGQLYKFTERCKLSENHMRLCHKIFFGEDISILDGTSPFTVTPATPYTHHDLKKYWSQKRQYLEQSSTAETTQCNSEEDAIQTSNVSSQPVEKSLSIDIESELESQADKNRTQVEKLEDGKEMDSEKNCEGPIPKKLKLDQVGDKESNNSQPTKPLTLLNKSDKQSTSINSQNMILTTVKVPVKKGSYVTLSKQSTDQSGNSNEKIQLIKRTIKTADPTTKNDSSIENDRGQIGDPDLFKCTKPGCSKVFSSIVKRARHNLNMHTVFDCDICVSTHTGQRRLKIHFFKVHALGTSYKCSRCELVFGKGVTFLAHTKDCKTLMDN